MKYVKKIIALFVTLLSVAVVYAQNEKVPMADGMRSNGRIYVVVAVMLIILAGLVLYMVRIDRKLSRLEKDK